MTKGIVFALVAAFVLPVPAGIAVAGQNDVIREGSCGNASDWKVKVSPENGRLEGSSRSTRTSRVTAGG